MNELKGELLQHQIEAVNKLKKVKVGALFMEQGLGKTITALELIRLRFISNKVNKLIWLCPCSIKNSIKDMIIEFFPRNMLQDVIICGIETLSSSIKTNSYLLGVVNKYRCFLVVDESLLIKNYYALRTQNIGFISVKCKYKLILNGTPVSKNEADLFSQFNILDWRILGYKSFWSFAANHLEYDKYIQDKVVRCLNLDYLSKKIEPYTYQVKKEECIKLPLKHYSNRFFYMTELQEEHYYNVADKLLMEVDELRPESIYRMFSALQCILSGLFVWEEKGHLLTRNFFKSPIENPRIQKLLDIITSEKTIVFCKYTHEIDTITSTLNSKKDNVAVRFDGKISNKKRMENIETFKDSASYLIANKECAGLGLNLQFCSNVIYYDNDWTLSTRIQSEDRVHRIGQKNEIYIQDICCYHSLDERIKKCLERKENMLECFRDRLNETQNGSNEALKEWLFINKRKRKNFSLNDLEDDYV